MKNSDLDLVKNVQWIKERKHNIFFDPGIEPIKLDGEPTKWKMIVRSNDKKLFIPGSSDNIQKGDIVINDGKNTKALITDVSTEGDFCSINISPQFGSFETNENIQILRKKDRQFSVINTGSIHRLITNRVAISVRTDDYILIKNQMIHKAVMGYGLNAKLNLENTSVYRNSVFSMVYDFDYDNSIKDVSSGDLIYKLVVRNSYNGSVKLDVELVIFRVICKNMLAIPIKRVKVNKKHYYGNFSAMGKRTDDVSVDVINRVQSLIKQVVNDEVFDDIREKVLLAKKTRSVELNWKFLKNFPINQLVIILGMINKYANMDVNFLNSQNKVFSLNNPVGFRDAIGFIINSRKKEDAVYESRYLEKIEEIKTFKYPEKIVNLWGLYNLFVKIIQMMIEDKEHRFERTRMIGKYLFKNI